ncbi:unnamed protein product [Cuscuta campestris]|uniref:Uncharacterized protein n=1 Tax=Cuscuta campestris TaxID=132261 RepID=A0A484LLK0_9ASTE|nr:unnamed protein product [Cuscuta campestris]
MRKRGRPPKIDDKSTRMDNSTTEERPEKEIPSEITPEQKKEGEESGFDGTLDPDQNLINANKIVTEQPKSYAEVVGVQEELNLDLKYIPAEIIDGTPIARFSTDDVIEPGEYWESALICCVLGANPPLEVDIMNRKDIPIWIQFPDLEMKYWSLTGLSRLGSTIGKPIKRDGATASRRKWAYARIMIEVQINQTFPDQINFINEEGRIITQTVTYEWEPTICSHCDRIGHKLEKCRRKTALKEANITKKMVWKPKAYPKETEGKDAENHSHKEDREEPETPTSPKSDGKNNADESEELKDEEQAIHCQGKFIGDDRVFFITFIYAHNDPKKRKNLWEFLQKSVTTSAWCVLGDFNTVLHLDERIGGNAVSREELQEFQDCLNHCGLDDLPFEGPKLTWTNNQGIGKRIYSKLDRVLGNMDWLIKFDMKVQFFEGGISDHSPMVLKFINQRKPSHSFKFCEMWTLDPAFPRIVAEVWDKEHGGHSMYQIIQKLKQLKDPLRQLNRRKYKSLDNQIDELRSKLHTLQERLKQNDSNTKDLEMEKDLKKELHNMLRANFLMKTQQSKVDWISMGDQNTKLFYAWIKKRKMQNHISSIANAEGKGKHVEANYADDINPILPKFDVSDFYMDDAEIGDEVAFGGTTTV